MSTDWKPGDVAMVTWVDDYDGDVQTAVRVMVSNGTTDDAPGQRRPAWWGGDGYLAAGMKGLSARPLVVIDPEDREQVERLVAAFYDIDLQTVASRNDRVQAALREFANPTPPKPDEPQGLGAVAEDADGNRWVRTDPGVCAWTKWDRPVTRHGWSNVAAVRVLSEGVQP